MMYFHHGGPEAIYMLTANMQADRDDLTPADRKTLARLVAAIKTTRQADDHRMNPADGWNVVPSRQ